MVNFTLKTDIAHESQGNYCECDFGFSSETYFGIHQFGNEFLLNGTSFKIKQAHPQQVNGKGE